MTLDDAHLPDESPRAFDLAICWELAEHLPPEAADTLTATLARYTRASGRLLFTAARPGQGGYGHVNEQPIEYWESRLRGRGFELADAEPLRATWQAVCGPCRWYPSNLMMFQRLVH